MDDVPSPLLLPSAHVGCGGAMMRAADKPFDDRINHDAHIITARYSSHRVVRELRKGPANANDGNELPGPEGRQTCPF